MPFPVLTIAYGVLLILLGAIAYFVSESRSFTALIPAFFGVAEVILGVVANKKEHLRKHLMHGALLVAVVAMLGAVGNPRSPVVKLLSGAEVTWGLAAISQVLMLVLSLVYIVLGIQSFVAARRRQALAEG